MTDANYTHITVVLDRSGSMGIVAPDTIGGFNEFLRAQKENPGRATMTLVQFDHEYLATYRALALECVPELTRHTYQPRGNTALLDALGRAIVETGQCLAALQEDQRPGKVILVVLTDGQENASREYTNEKIREMITHQQEMYNWLVVFLGANMDAFSVAGGLGVYANNTSGYHGSPVGTRKAIDDVTRGVTSYRLCSAPIAEKFDFFNRDEDKEEKDKEEKDIVATTPGRAGRAGLAKILAEEGLKKIPAIDLGGRK